MNLVGWIDLSSFLLAAGALGRVWLGRSAPAKSLGLKVTLTAVLAVTLAHHAINTLHRSGILGTLDFYENYMDMLLPLVWGGFFYAIWQESVTAAIREEKEQVKFYFDVVGVMIVALDKQGRVTLINKKGCEILRSGEKDTLGKNWFDNFIPVSERETVRKVFHDGIQGQPDIRMDSFENKVLTKDGQERTILWTNSILHDENGDVTGTLSAGRDVTDLRQIETTLLATKAHERALIDNLPHLAWVKDTEGKFILVNQAFARSCGRDITKIIGKTDLDVWPRSLAEKYRADDAQVMRTRSRTFTEEPIEGVDGWQWVETFKSPILDQKGQVIGTTGVARDITARKRAEEELIDSREMLQLVLDNIPQRVFWKDRNSVYMGANKPLAQDCGYDDPNQLIGKTDYETASAANADLYRADDQKVMKEDRAKLNYEEPQVKPDGSEAWLKTSKVPLHDQVGNVIGVLGTYEDISERKRAEQALRESEEKYRTLIETAGDAIFVADAETGYLIDANRKAEELIGLSVQKIIGMHQTELHPKGEALVYREYFKNHTEQGEVKTIGFVFHREKGKIPVQITGGMTEVNGRKVIMGIFRDITDLRLVEEALRRDKDGLEKAVSERTEKLHETLRSLEDAKRLSDIGALAATVAHELRNPLGVIKTAIYNIRQKIKDDSLTRHLANIDKKIAESELIIKNLLSYAQIKTPSYEKVNVWEILQECVEQCRHKYGDKDSAVTVKAHKGKPSGSAQVDSVHLNELFVNILDNAYQALPGPHGKITVDFDYNEKDNVWSVVFTDNGVGIEKNILPNVFDPFFTTRSRGTGLGLSVCNQIVNLYSGRIEIASVKGEGTSVTISLPILRKGSAA